MLSSIGIEWNHIGILRRCQTWWSWFWWCLSSLIGFFFYSNTIIAIHSRWNAGRGRSGRDRCTIGIASWWCWCWRNTIVSWRRSCRWHWRRRRYLNNIATTTATSIFTSHHHCIIYTLDIAICTFHTKYDINIVQPSSSILRIEESSFSSSISWWQCRRWR